MNKYETSEQIRTDKFSGACERCVYPVVRQMQHPLNTVLVACPGCGADVSLERLYATVTDVNCDPRCQWALGRLCSCGCGGANHQSGYIPPTVTGELPAHVVEGYRERVKKQKEAAAKAAATRRVKTDAKKAERKREQDEATEAFIEDLPDEVQAVMVTDEIHDETRGVEDLLCDMRNHDIISDMRSRLWQYGSLSEKQVAFAARLIEQERQYRARKAADDNINWIEAPEGRVEVEGVVLSVKEKMTDFGITLKFLLRCGDVDEGAWKVWSTVPRVLQAIPICNPDGTAAGSRCVDRGDRVRFTAKVTRSDDDKSFSFASRPTNAELVS